MKRLLINTIFYPFIIVVLCASIFACNKTVSGRVSVKGNEPFSYLLIVTEKHGPLKIVGKLKGHIWNNYQGNYLKVKGKIVKKGKGPGFPPEFEVEEVVRVIHKGR